MCVCFENSFTVMSTFVITTAAPCETTAIKRQITERGPNKVENNRRNGNPIPL